MLPEYLHWQFFWAPRWLLAFIWNMQRASAQFFSVKIMLRTLLSHWHKDAVPYTGGTLSKIAMTFGWNMVSRGIGFIIRSIVLLVWLVIEAVLLAVSLTALILLFLWPLLAIASFLLGFALFFT